MSISASICPARRSARSLISQARCSARGFDALALCKGVAPPPQGLGTTVEKIVALLKVTEEGQAALVEFDRVVRQGPGGANNPEGRNQHSKVAEAADGEVNVDIVNSDQAVDAARPTGNSQQQGLRRLDLAKQAGNQQAADLLARMLDPDDPLTVNAACVAMGWRQPVRTVRDTPDGLADATVRKIGVVDTVKAAWRRASAAVGEMVWPVTR